MGPGPASADQPKGALAPVSGRVPVWKTALERQKRGFSALKAGGNGSPRSPAKKIAKKCLHTTGSVCYTAKRFPTETSFPFSTLRPESWEPETRTCCGFSFFTPCHFGPQWPSLSGVVSQASALDLHLLSSQKKRIGTRVNTLIFKELATTWECHCNLPQAFGTRHVPLRVTLRSPATIDEKSI